MKWFTTSLPDYYYIDYSDDVNPVEHALESSTTTGK